MMEVKHLVKRYNGREAVLDGIADREYVTVHGKSECGKTTLLNIVGGVGRSTSRAIMTDGKSLVRPTEDDLAKHATRMVLIEGRASGFGGCQTG